MPFGDRLPAAPAVARAEDVRALVVEAMAVDRGVGGVRIEVRRLDDADLRPGLEESRRDVLPVRAFVGRAPDEPVVGAGPDQPVLQRRRSDVIDHAAPRPLLRSVVRRRRVERCRNAGIVARQVGADGLPRPAFVRRPPDPLVAEIERVLAPAPGQRQRPFAAVFVGESERRIDVARLPGLEVEPVDPPAVDDVRIVRVGRDLVGSRRRR